MPILTPAFSESLAIFLSMSEQTTASIITLAIVAALVLWVPAIHLLCRHARAPRLRAERQSSPPEDQSNDRPRELRFVLRDKG